MALDSRERIAAVFNFEEPDRVPVYDLMRNRAALEHFAGLKPVTWENMREAACKACAAGLDATRTIRYPQRVRESEENGFTYFHEEWTTWLTGRPFEGYEAFVAWLPGEIERLEAWDPWESGWFDEVVGDHRALQEGMGSTVLVWGDPGTGFYKAYYQASMEYFSYLMVDEPALLLRWLDARCEWNLRKIAAIADEHVAPIAIIGEDIAGKGATLFSPAFLRKAFFPNLRRVVGAYHDIGMKVIFHSDGYLMDILADLVATEIDGLNPLEPLAGMDLATIKGRYGKRLVLVGGIDASELLPRGTPAQVREATIEALRIAAPGSGYCVGSSTELNEAMPLENILAMIETAWEYGRYPLKLQALAHA